jgi:hypothetical protein
MVSTPPPRPPGRTPPSGDVLWCAKHKVWVPRAPSGKYVCPHGHILGGGKAASESKGFDGPHQ